MNISVGRCASNADLCWWRLDTDMEPYLEGKRPSLTQILGYKLGSTWFGIPRYTSVGWYEYMNHAKFFRVPSYIHQ